MKKIWYGFSTKDNKRVVKSFTEEECDKDFAAGNFDVWVPPFEADTYHQALTKVKENTK